MPARMRESLSPFDDGAHWSPLGRNLPTAWVTDLLVHGDDLIAATQGRAIWVLDDVTPLRQTDAGYRSCASVHTRGRVARAFRQQRRHAAAAGNTARRESAGGRDHRLLARCERKRSRDARYKRWKGSAGAAFREQREAREPRAKRYFAAAWLKPPRPLETTAGFHRFVWNFHAGRPPAISYSYSMAAVWGRDTPTKPEGPYVLPGNYTVVLSANGHTYSAPLHVAEDPRIKVTAADLKASFDLSQRIAQLLAQTREGYGERKSVLKQLDALFPDEKSSNSEEDDTDTQAPEEKKPADTLHALGRQVRQKPAAGAPTFELVDAILTSVESISRPSMPRRRRRSARSSTTRHRSLRTFSAVGRILKRGPCPP